MLGEGPIWSPAESALYWLDIEERHVYRLDAKDLDAEDAEPRRWDVPVKPGCLALRRGGGLIVALQTGVHALDLDTGALTLLVAPEPDRPTHRLNDGSADANGRLWVGSMDDKEETASGSLYRIGPDRTATPALGGLLVSNGIGWSPDGATMYHADSPTRTITAYDFDLAAGAISNPRPFAVDDGCYPDGLTVDAEGYVWSAKWDGWRVVRYAPDGSIDRVGAGARAAAHVGGVRRTRPRSAVHLDGPDPAVGQRARRDPARRCGTGARRPRRDRTTRNRSAPSDHAAD